MHSLCIGLSGRAPQESSRRDSPKSQESSRSAPGGSFRSSRQSPKRAPREQRLALSTPTF
eukprot:7385712-Pyramimonas_sp.AAC.1